MSYMTQYRCTICHQAFPKEPILYTCPRCGESGILDIEYDYTAIAKILTKKSLAHNHDFSMWRYAPLLPMPTDHIPDMLKIGGTPLYESHKLATRFGVARLFIKDEGLNPSGSTKDRASGVAVLNALASGATTIACSSTGNAASSLAASAARMGLQAVIFVPKRAPIGKLTQLSIYGAHVLMVDGDYKAAYRLSKQAIAKYGWYNRNAAINPVMVEGKKTVALEIAEQLKWQPTDWVAISVGDGCSLAGVYKGFHDAVQLGLSNRIPKLLGVQSLGCAPFVTAFENGAELMETDENTIADSIAVGIPRNPVKAMNAVKLSDGAFIAVSDEHILSSMSLLVSMEGIFGEPAGVTALAGVESAVKRGLIKPHETVTVIMTGNGLKDPTNAKKTGRLPALIGEDMSEVAEYLAKNGVQ